MLEKRYLKTFEFTIYFSLIANALVEALLLDLHYLSTDLSTDHT